MSTVVPTQIDANVINYRGQCIHRLGTQVGQVPLRLTSWGPNDFNQFWLDTGRVPYRRSLSEGQAGWPMSLMTAPAGVKVGSFTWARYSAAHTDLNDVNVTALRQSFLKTSSLINPFQYWRFRTLGNGVDAGPYGSVGNVFIQYEDGYGLALEQGSIPAQEIDGSEWVWNSGNIDIYTPTNFVVEVGYGDPVHSLSREEAGFDWPAYSE